VSNSAEKRVLIIDDIEGMRTQLRMTMTTAGFNKIQAARDIKDALARMKDTQFDVILCDYMMGDSTDGQQFLEYLRADNLLPRNTIFIMVTAEQSYARVVSASECAPDGYLLKPFTGSQFDARLEVLMEKQSFMEEINTLADQENWVDVINRCDKKISGEDPLGKKFLIDLLKIKAFAFQQLGDYAEAINAYNEIIAIRPLGWAKLGVSRMMHLMGDTGKAQALVREIIAEVPQFLAAYDFIGKTMVETGDKEGALAILQETRRVSPGSLSRLREMSHLALHLAKPEVAEELLNLALKKNKFSPVREMNDYVMLSKAMLAQSRPNDAMAILNEAAEAFPHGHERVLLLTAVSSVYFHEGNYQKAASVLEEAMSIENTGNLSSHATLSLSEACFLLGREEQAHEYLSNVVRHDSEDKTANTQIRDVCVKAGKSEEQTDEILGAIHKTVSQPHLAAGKAAAEGRFSESIQVLLKEIERAPNNLRIKGNAAILIAIDMVCNGVSESKMEQCLKFGKAISQKSPKHPKLVYLKALLSELDVSNK
jgi:tetratricopeptide (TPR) repeat protein